MADVAVHHTEEEREGDHGEERGVGLPIARKPVGVDEVLENRCELVLADVGGRLLPRLRAVGHEHGAGVALPDALLDQHGLYLVLLRRRIPTIRPEIEVGALKEVQRRIDGLLFGTEHAPLLDKRVRPDARSLQQAIGLAAHKVLVRLEKPLLVLDLHLEALLPLQRSLPARRPCVRVHAIGRTDLGDLLAHCRDRRPCAVVLEVDNED
mmetsp:Transcript_49597/g.106178  ORF Transcript_49597/g.106178 Transcript_49597/m.106178 type:complete len:209 (-) Transcript_49597:853-1479(-)